MLKKYIVLLLLLLSASGLTAQVITGQVFDETHTPLEGAVVYLDGTTISVSTGSEGYFSIKGDKNLPAALIVSFVGFIPVTINNPYTGNRLEITLVPDAIIMEEVVIKGNTVFSRKEMLNAFREQFLGNSRAASSCKIENEDDIRLRFDTSNNTLYAEASRPLRIVNERLKYKVTFDLIASEVRYRTKSLGASCVSGAFFGGTVFFSDISQNNEALKQRKETYLGSTMHFVKSLVNGELADQKFSIYSKKTPIDPASRFKVTDTMGIKKVTYVYDLAAEAGSAKRDTDLRPGDSKRFEILYNSKHQSFFMYNTGIFYANSNGLFWPLHELTFGGDMGDRRIGDMLPSDYKPEE
jgi:hypothetical protein